MILPTLADGRGPHDLPEGSDPRQFEPGECMSDPALAGDRSPLANFGSANEIFIEKVTSD
jgi:hypothetical protein